MSDLLIETKNICVPGDVIAESMDYLPSHGTCREDGKIVANKLGLVNVNGRLISVIPVSGKYSPRKGDTIIGKVFDITMSGWRININCAYSAMLMVRDATNEFIAKTADLTKFFSFDDIIVAKIGNVTSQNLIDLTMKGPGLKKLNGGVILNVTPSKVPRIIGKNGSMVTMIKGATDARIIVGQNGIVWVSAKKAENENLAIDAIKMIENNSHVKGLTDIIKQYLEDNAVEVETKKEDNQDESESVEESQEDQEGDDNE